MRKLVWGFGLIGLIGAIAGILSVLKWGIFHLDRVYLLFAFSINGILIIIGFFGAWVINSFDDARNRLKNHKAETEKKFDDLEKDMASISNRLMLIEGKIIDLKLSEKRKNENRN